MRKWPRSVQLYVPIPCKALGENLYRTNGHLVARLMLRDRAEHGQGRAPRRDK